MVNKIKLIIIVCLVGLVSVAINIGVLKVSGNSMYPTFKDGDILLFYKTNIFTDIKVGDYVIVNISDLELQEHFIVKQVTRINKREEVNGIVEYYFVESVNKNMETLDSNIVGSFKKSKIKGVIICGDKDNQN